MTPAGKRKHRVRLEPRVLDDNGDPTGPFTLDGSLTVWARVQPLKGSEPALQERLVGRQPIGITILRSHAADAIDSAWRAVWSGQVFNIQTVVPAEDQSEILILAVADQTNGG